MKTEIDNGVKYTIDWPWTDEELDWINYHARRQGTIIIETLGIEIEYEYQEKEPEVIQ